jgi:chromosome segregation ATPase
LFSEFGKVLIKSAVSELRCEFQKFAMEAVEMALCGDNVGELQEQVDKIEAELSKLRNGFEKLNEEALKQKGGNAELRRQMREKEQEIKMKERQLSQLNKRISRCQKEFKDEQVKHEEIERALRQELDEVKSKYNKAKGKLLAKDAADHIARDQLPELRQKIAELEQQLQTGKAKRKY